MDLKVYYRKIRELEASIMGPTAVVVSLDTPDGGKAGVKIEVPKFIAARTIVEGSARMGTAEETDLYREEMLEAKRLAEELANRQRLQITVVSDADLQALRGARNPGR